MSQDNNVVQNVAMLEQYGKNVANINQQMLEIFKKLGDQTKQIGSVWRDAQYDHFKEDFDRDIMKNVQQIAFKLEMYAKYIEKQCQFHRMAQQNRYY